MTDFNASQATCTDGALENLRVQVLSTQPGDIVVLSFPHALSADTASRIRNVWRDICPHTDVRCVVLQDGGHVDAVLRPDEEAGG